MNYAELCIIKRDGKKEDFSFSKIKNAIAKAYVATGKHEDDKEIAQITSRVAERFKSTTIRWKKFRHGRRRVDACGA